jgi:hypothetical protein
MRVPIRVGIPDRERVVTRPVPALSRQASDVPFPVGGSQHGDVQVGIGVELTRNRDVVPPAPGLVTLPHDVPVSMPGKTFVSVK